MHGFSVHIFFVCGDENLCFARDIFIVFFFIVLKITVIFARARR